MKYSVTKQEYENTYKTYSFLCDVCSKKLSSGYMIVAIPAMTGEWGRDLMSRYESFINHHVCSEECANMYILSVI